MTLFLLALVGLSVFFCYAFYFELFYFKVGRRGARVQQGHSGSGAGIVSPGRAPTFCRRSPGNTRPARAPE